MSKNGPQKFLKALGWLLLGLVVITCIVLAITRGELKGEVRQTLFMLYGISSIIATVLICASFSELSCLHKKQRPAVEEDIMMQKL
jgi:type II secretory pathway component PulF